LLLEKVDQLTVKLAALTEESKKDKDAIKSLKIDVGKLGDDKGKVEGKYEIS
jgi:hypothetical protein